MKSKSDIVMEVMFGIGVVWMIMTGVIMMAWSIQGILINAIKFILQ